MSWREIPKSVSDVFSYLPTLVNWKIMAQEGKLYYWVPETKFNKQQSTEPMQHYPDYEY